MSITKNEAASARAAAAQKADATDRLSALEVERRGYVQRGDVDGIEAVDDEIAHWSNIAGIPVEAGPASDSDDSGDAEADSDSSTDDSDSSTDDSDSSTDDNAEQAATTSRGRAKAAAAAKD